MRARTCVASIAIALVALVGALGARATAQDRKGGAVPPVPPVVKSKFDADLAAAQGCLTAARWKDARVAFTKLMDENANSPAVLLHLTEIEDGLRTATFKAQWKAATVAELLGPACVKFGPGRVAEFETVPSFALDGWSAASGAAVFERQFENEVTVEFPWTWFRGDLVVPPPMVMLAYDVEKKGGYLLGISVQQGRFTGYVIRSDDGKDNEIARDASRGVAQYAESRAVKYIRSAQGVSVSVDGTEIARANDTKYRSGFVAMVPSQYGVPTSVRITGKLSESYVRRLTAEAENEDYREWEAMSWSRDAAFPKWVTELEAKSNAAAGALPGGVPDYRMPDLRARICRFYDGDNSGLAEVRSDVESLPQPARDYVNGLLLWSAGDFAGADEKFRLTLGRDSAFGAARAGIARFAFDAGRVDEAKGLAEDALAMDPEFPPSYELLAEIALAQDDIVGARAVLDRAATKGTLTLSIRRLRSILLRMERGPSWTRRFAVQTAHFDIASDHSVAVCGEVGKQLEDAFNAYQVKFRPVTPKHRARVFVFSGQQGYLDYAADIGGDLRNTLGVYIPSMRQLAVFLHDDRVELWNTVRHEGFHQYIHQLTGNVPIWLNEGYAEYFGFSRRKFGKTVTGQADETQLGMLAARRLSFTPLRQLFTMAPAEFMAKADVHYVQAWSVIHFLRETKDPEMSALLPKYLDALITGRSTSEAFAEVLEPVLPALEVNWRAYLTMLTR